MSRRGKLALVLPLPATPPADPYARIARLMLARGWGARDAFALFDGLGVPPEVLARIAAAIA
jgi:hypothetical protein